MVECRTFPLVRVVTDLAIGAETGCHMVRICRLVEVLLMTRHAVRGQALECAAHVTHRTVVTGVTTGQREGRGMLEIRAFPCDRVVTRFAIGAETGRDVVRIICVVVILLMARHAIG